MANGCQPPAVGAANTEMELGVSRLAPLTAMGRAWSTHRMWCVPFVVLSDLTIQKIKYLSEFAED
eukprot:SAG31_NODE_12061_length_972_cov_0.982818_1_plen_64_part_10